MILRLLQLTDLDSSFGFFFRTLHQNDFPHPTGFTISQNAKLGEGCKIWQNVTIAAKTIEGEDFPEIGDNVNRYAGVVMAGDIKIGSNAIIGANSVVLKDVSIGAFAVGVPAKIIPNQEDLKKP